MGGVLPTRQPKPILKGSMSNVDWVPTLLTFACVIPSSQLVIIYDDNDCVSFICGHNQYAHIIEDDSSDSDNLNKEDHILFHIVSTLDGDTNDFTKSLDLFEFADMEQIAMVFYDNDGHLCEFLNYNKTTTVNSGWCIATDEYPQAEAIATASDKFSLTPCVDIKNKPEYGLSQASTDSTTTLTEIGDSDDTVIESKEIIHDTINFYVCTSRNSDYLFGNFYSCVDDDTCLDEALTAAVNSNALLPLMMNLNLFSKTMMNV